MSKNGMQKSTANDVYERLRREVACLVKLRHPSLVKIIEPLEETKGTMRFVTEPITSCLQHMIDVNSSSAGSSSLDSGELDEIVIQKGVLQLAEGLNFLHTAAGLVHLDIQPSSVLINVKGDWKLSGLGFVENFKEASKEYFLPRFDPRLPSFVQVNLDYSAPELILDHTLDVSNDIFSLGCLLVALFTFKAPMRTDNNPNVYKQEFGSINKLLRDQRIPQYLHDMIPQMVSRYPAERLTLDQFKNSSLFDNVLVRTINFLDDFPVKLPSEQQTFMNGFSKLIDQFPKSVLQKKILPTLLEELGKEETLVGSILSNILEVGKDMSQLGFSEKILPGIKKVKKVLSAQVVLLNYMETLKSRLNGNEFRDDILPIILDTMDNAPPEIQELSLQKIPIIIEKLDFVTLKNEVFPVLGSVFVKTTSLSVKLEALSGFEQLVSNGLDKYAVTEKLLPLLNGMKTREPKVMIGALSVYSKVIGIVDVEVLARVIVPQLLSMSLESMLNLGQFRAFMDEIKRLLDRIENEHGKKLSQVQVVDPMVTRNSPSPLNGNKSGEKVTDFESLVYGRNKTTNQPTPTPTTTTTPSGSSISSSTPSTIPSISAAPSVTSSFGSLKLEPSRKPSLATLQPLSSSNGHVNSSVSQASSSSPQLNWQQSLSPKSSVGFGSTSIMNPLTASSSINNLKPSPATGNWDSLRNASNSSNTMSSTVSYSNPMRNNTAQTTAPAIDWSLATKPKISNNNDFGDFQSTSTSQVSSPLTLPGPSVGFSPMTPSIATPSPPGWNSNTPSLQPQQKFHINRPNPTTNQAPSNNQSMSLI